MPNTAIAIGESMTCLAGSNKTDKSLSIAKKIFDSVGKTLVIEESLMIPATALCACGIAFFLRAVRALPGRNRNRFSFGRSFVNGSTNCKRRGISFSG